MKYIPSTLVALSLFTSALGAHAGNEQNMRDPVEKLADQCKIELTSDQAFLAQRVMMDLPKALLSLNMPSDKMVSLCKKMSDFQNTWNLPNTDENRWRLVTSVTGLQHNAAQLLAKEISDNPDSIARVSSALGIRPKDVREYSVAMTAVRDTVQMSVNQLASANNIAPVDIINGP